MASRVTPLALSLIHIYSGRGWRRVVPSPVPQDIVELETIRDLMEDGCVVIAAGGGGIPVTVSDGMRTAVDAIVDKDLTSAILAWRVRADILVILTAVELSLIHISLCSSLTK